MATKKKYRVSYDFSTILSELVRKNIEKYFAEDQYFHIKSSSVCPDQEPKIFWSAETNFQVSYMYFEACENILAKLISKELCHGLNMLKVKPTLMKTTLFYFYFMPI